MGSLRQMALVSCVLACGGLAAACGGGDDGGTADADVDAYSGPASSPNGLPLDRGVANPAPTVETFVPFQRDFQGFTSWTHFELASEAPVGDGNAHRAGKRVVYINRMPAHGLSSFPAGTIIIKTMQTGEVFARVKRGGDYNRNGAFGWEWFELTASGADWVIAWRGITPPVGFCYGGIVGGACNDCHRAFAGNDFVATAVLDLSRF